MAKFYSETAYIKGRTRKIREERLDFMDGERLGDLSIGIESNATLRKVRRIIEKRVSQDYYKAHSHVKGSARYGIRRHTSNTLRNLYGYVPESFTYCCRAA